MRTMCLWARAVLVGVLVLAALPALAADYPVPKNGDWVAADFRFHSGQVMPALRLHYTTIGNSDGEVVLILHGQVQSGSAMLTAGFAGQLFGPDQTLDAANYFIILPDAIGADSRAAVGGEAGGISALLL